MLWNKTYEILTGGGKIAFCLSAIFFSAFGVKAGDISWHFEGSKMYVRATSALAGKGLVLLWDSEDKGADNVVAWAHSTNILAAVGSAGSSVTVDLSALGIANSTPCRIASATSYQVLDKCLMDDRNRFIDTGILGKNVYGIRMGFYPTSRGTAERNDLNGALCCGKADSGNEYMDEGFHIGIGCCTEEEKKAENWVERLETDPVQWGWCAYNSTSDLRPCFNIDSMNDIAFTNNGSKVVFSFNGVVKKSNLSAGAASKNDLTFHLGRTYPMSVNSGVNYSLLGYWGWLQFFGADGELILDYVPAKRTSDGIVGFYDRAANAFVLPKTSGYESLSDNGCTPTGAMIDTELTVVTDVILPNRCITTSMEAGSLMMTIPSGLVGEELIVAWDDEDKGDNIADWAHTATAVVSASEGENKVRLGKLGVTSGSTVRVFAANRYTSLTLLHTTSNKSYVDTKIKDTEVYTVRFGFRPTGQSQSYGSAIGTGEASKAKVYGFVVSSSGGSGDLYRLLWAIQGHKPSGRHTITAGEIAEIAFVDNTCIYNGATHSSGKTGSVGITGNNMYIGRSSKDEVAMYADWTYVKFGDKDDNPIYDAIPVKRKSDSVVGFYDKVSKTFMPSVNNSTHPFTAGDESGEEVLAINAVSAALQVKLPSFVITIK